MNTILSARQETYDRFAARYISNWSFVSCVLRVLIRHLKDNTGEIEVPRHVLEALAETFLPDIRTFFATEEGQKEFEKWKAAREAKKAKEADKKSRTS